MTKRTKAEWDAIEHSNSIARTQDRFRRHVGHVLSGQMVGVLCYGPPGVGKTRIAREEIQKAGLKAIELKPHTAEDILDACLLSKGKSPILLEEADNVFSTPNKNNVMKLILDGEGPRFWPRSPRYKQGVSLKVPVIMVSNVDLSDPASFARKNESHMRAIIDRTEPIAISGDRLELWEFAAFLAVRRKMLVSDGNSKGYRSLAVQNKALAVFTEHLFEWGQVSPRTLKNVCRFIDLSDGCDDRWEADIESMLTREPQRGEVVPESPEIIP